MYKTQVNLNVFCSFSCRFLLLQYSFSEICGLRLYCFIIVVYRIHIIQIKLSVFYFWGHVSIFQEFVLLFSLHCVISPFRNLHASQWNPSIKQWAAVSARGYNVRAGDRWRRGDGVRAGDSLPIIICIHFLLQIILLRLQTVRVKMSADCRCQPCAIWCGIEADVNNVVMTTFWS